MAPPPEEPDGVDKATYSAWEAAVVAAFYTTEKTPRRLWRSAAPPEATSSRGHRLATPRAAPRTEPGAAGLKPSFGLGSSPLAAPGDAESRRFAPAGRPR